MSFATRKFLSPLAVALLMLVTFLLYYPGLTGDFIFDDFPNIVNNDDAYLADWTLPELIKVFTSGVASSLGRPLTMFTFSLNLYFTGAEPFYFKLTNLFIHLLICPGIYLLARELITIGAPTTRTATARTLALLVAAIWALHPLFVSSVLYVVQRMNQLAVLMTVYTLLYYCRFRQRDNVGRQQALLALAVLGGLTAIGVLFKENAVLIVPYLLAIEFFLLRFTADSTGQTLFLRLFIGGMVLLPAVAVLILVITSPTWVTAAYDSRDFTMWERLMTEAGILWMYIRWVLMPDTRDFVFYYDNYPVAQGLLDPATTLFAIAGLIALGIACIAFRKKTPLLCFGIAFFFIGHALESTVYPLELVFEHRNYLPSFGLILAGVYTLTHMPSVLGQKPALAFICLFVVFLAHGTLTEARKWSNTEDHLLGMYRGNPDSHRVNYSLGHFYNAMAGKVTDNTALYDAASFYHRRALDTDSHAIRAHVGVILADSQNGKALDPAVVDELELRLRTLKLNDKHLTEFTLLADCWYRNYCKFDKAVLARFITALGSNKATNPLALQATLAQLGAAVMGVFGNSTDGLAILYLARDLRKDELTLIDLQIIQTEMQLGNYQQARLIADEAQLLRGPEALEEELSVLRARLDAVAPAQ